MAVVDAALDRILEVCILECWNIKRNIIISASIDWEASVTLTAATTTQIVQRRYDSV